MCTYINELSYVSFRAFICEVVEGLCIYLDHSTVSIHYCIPSKSLPFRTAVLIQQLGRVFFFLKRLEGLKFIDFIPFEKEFFEK